MRPSKKHYLTIPSQKGHTLVMSVERDNSLPVNAEHHNYDKIRIPINFIRCNGSSRINTCIYDGTDLFVY